VLTMDGDGQHFGDQIPVLLNVSTIRRGVWSLAFEAGGRADDQDAPLRQPLC
jgi:hypothetical protein